MKGGRFHEEKRAAPRDRGIRLDRGDVIDRFRGAPCPAQASCERRRSGRLSRFRRRGDHRLLRTVGCLSRRPGRRPPWRRIPALHRGGDDTTHPCQRRDEDRPLRRSAKSADLTMSVCTGAFVLASTGLLSGRSATTHHNAFGDSDSTRRRRRSSIQCDERAAPIGRSYLHQRHLRAGRAGKDQRLPPP